MRATDGFENSGFVSILSAAGDARRLALLRRINIVDPVKEIFLQYGIKGDWEAILGLGVGNRIYATSDVILRIAADHPDSLSDAYTESVAAPAARAAGVLTPRLIAFDDSQHLINRPFSLWERVHGETLGVLETDPFKMPNTW
ncbi:MAG TPA: hypothetical protein V6C65_00345, partial [Allocoleopsis sp.]